MISGLFIGMLFGGLLQSGQFCFVSGFRNIVYQKNPRFLTALLIAVSIQATGFFTLQSMGLLTIPEGTLPVTATIIGGFLFGIGMVLAGCCGSGAWFRSGEGLTGTWIALFAFVVTMASAWKGSLKHWIDPLLIHPAQADTIYKTLNISPWFLVAVLIIITVGLLIYQHRHPRYSPPSSGKFKRLPLNLTAVLIGILGIIAWYFSAESGRNFGFGISVPSANVIQYLVTGQQRYFNWGMLFVIGIFAGSMISAKIRGEFTLTLPPDGKTVVKRLTGGIVMGIGATLAGGCTVTNSLVATAYFSWQGWISTLTIMAGVWITSYFIRPSQCRI
ncbi:YeeE/YedE family protein [Morganella psychrotolerans]|uniref:ABC transporter permease n=1 Tax=Morganella psychrotolerans TaxID=368603 RepID=A0A1B8HP23_9GAMM|nr:YeeE/YedE family protein [Morganella psychrotolerans]OBU11229.1 ABC transporter permease [Morganella psychrotolerans]